MLNGTSIFAKTLNYLEGRPRYITLMVTLILVGLLGLLDFWTGAEISVSIFYLVPIGLIAWRAGGRWAMFISCVATLGWVWADFADGWVYAHAVVWNAVIRFVYFALVGYLVASVKSSLEREHKLSRTDALTGAMNKFAFQEFAEAELERVRRYPHPLSIAYIDLDNFKAVNDRQGHAEGDKVLKTVVETLKSVMRKTDAVARLGGDEFAVVMIETNPDEVKQAFSKAQTSLLASMRRERWPVTFSIGIVTFLEPPHSLDDMINVADELMYTAKHNGKNRAAYRVIAPAPQVPDMREPERELVA